MIACAVLLALATVAVLEALTIVRARITAERVADQAAVLVGEVVRCRRRCAVPRGSSGAATMWW